jgi:hypothetical protein
MAIPVLLTAVNDTFVFLAISYRMVSSAMVVSTWRARSQSFFTGDGLLYLSKALLQSGQVYYLSVLWSHLCQHIYWSNLYVSVTIGVAILTSVFILSENIPAALRPALVSPYFALGSAMACRVFRIVFLGIMEGTQIDTSDTVSFYRSTTLDPRLRDDANDKRGRSPNFEISVAAEGTATEFNDEYPFGEGKLTGDEQTRDLSHRV